MSSAYRDTDTGSVLPRRGKQQHKDPETLVRAETRIIDVLRCLVIGLLVLVAISLSLATFKLSRKWELDSFHNEFEGIAARLAQVFLDKTTSKLWYAYTLSVAITDLANKSFPNTSISAFYDLGPGIAPIANAQRAFWSPMLNTRAQRKEFEAYTQESSGERQHTICYVCGGPSMQIGAPEAMVPIPTIQPRNCSEIQVGGLDGLIPKSACPLVQSLAAVHCECKAIDATAPSSPKNVSTRVFRMENGREVPVTGNGPNFPVWQTMAANQAIMYDMFSNPTRRSALQAMLKSGLPTFSLTTHPDDEFSTLMNGAPDNTPVTTLYFPVFQSAETQVIVGTFSMDFYWQQHFYSQIPINSDGIMVVFANSQGQEFTYEVQNDALNFIGLGDLHDSAFDSLFQETSFDDFQKRFSSLYAVDGDSHSKLRYKVIIYPSNEFRARYITSKPAVYTTVVVLIFVFTSAVFFTYDYLVRKRQEKVMNSAMRDDAIVASLFPASIRERLFAGSNKSSEAPGRTFVLRPAPRAQLRNLLSHRSTSMVRASLDSDTDPIADFFPRCSIIFADITGFTAWSSEREPAQVFRLLETVYRAFDQLAKEHGVFKIETAGDCYVAATGVPEAQEDHAIRITRFAHDCLAKMGELTRYLETLLGPGTADLSIRIGIHSGPVTGGVLRGDKARFQLFGDTMNTAARMESTGEASRVQVSASTAELMQQSGMSPWLTQREGGVFVKGKGNMQTYWVDPTSIAESTNTETVDISTESDLMLHPTMEIDTAFWGSENLDSTFSDTGNRSVVPVDKQSRLVDWNADLLSRLLQRIVARRNSGARNSSFPFSTKRSQPQPSLLSKDNVSSLAVTNTRNGSIDSTPIKDVADILNMPKFCGKTEQDYQDPDGVVLEGQVLKQLHEYVVCVADMYRDNTFHNFEHASHVAMSAWKIMNRIIKPQHVDYSSNPASKSRHSMRKQIKALSEQIHHSTFGISSDPLMQFAVVFCALIHDAEHTGITNSQLVKEEHEVAVKYNGKCVAEQNSVHICWELLLEERFADLWACICANEDEKTRFRQLVVNAVIATDIADKELQNSRKQRWDKAFANPELRSEASTSSNCTEKDINRKATVVFEYIIQASDVAHTMQHWCIYNKWNERLFEERYKAFLAGREPADPSVGWYKGELWFFDNYIIPLANKLEHCGVFGVSSDEYLNYAVENRSEWEKKGQELVEGLVQKYCRKPEEKSSCLALVV